jgi:hypothetical protein
LGDWRDNLPPLRYVPERPRGRLDGSHPCRDRVVHCTRSGRNVRVARPAPVKLSKPAPRSKPDDWEQSYDVPRPCHPKPPVEPRLLAPVARENLRKPRRGRDHRTGALHPAPHVAQPSLFVPLVRLPRVVGQAARDLEEAELPRWCRDLFSVLVRAAERDPRLAPRPGRITSRQSRASISDGPGGVATAARVASSR